ncbi:MAG TPA: DUF1697 domain-containing protein [Planctomycetota bacterium]|nr:DUF1697 domain-containing protein [Planctomycetota bacterium]
MARQRTSSGSSAASVYVALLRGINVGGKNVLPMAALAEIFSRTGCADVRTYIQSGNIVFTASSEMAERIPGLVPTRIAERFGIRPPIVLRSSAELRRAAAANPFLKAGAAPDSLHVAFLADLPHRARRSALDPRRSPGDSFALRGRELYLHLPNGTARTKLTNAYIDSTLGTTSTLRNWRTVLKLLELTD